MDNRDDKQLLTGDLALISKHRNALMGIAAVIICIFHEFLPVFPSGTAMFDIEEFVLRVSFYGVDVFLILSGMSVVFSLKKNGSVLQFYGRRALRILPVYLLSGIVMIFTEHWTFVDYLLNITGIRFFTTSVNSYLWFVTAIIIFYLAAPWFQKLLDKTGHPVITCIIALVIWYILSICLRPYIRGDLYYLINRIPTFVTGMMIGNLIKNGYKIKYRSVFWLVMVSLLVLGWVLSYSNNYYGYLELFGVYLNFLPTFALGLSTVYICAFILDLIKAKMLHKVLSFWGSFCFELYIVQRLFDAQLHYFIRSYDIWGIPRNLIMFFVLSLIAFIFSRVVNGAVDLIKQRLSSRTRL